MTPQENIIVDTHAHIFPKKEVGKMVLEGVKRVYDTPYYCTGSPEELAETMKKAGITHAVILNHAAANRGALSHLVEGNFFICAYSRKHPHLIPAIGLDQGMKRDPVEEIEHKLKWGAKAVKLHAVAQQFYVNDKEMWPIYRKCEETGLPVIFHCGKMMVEWLPEYAHPQLFYEVFRAFPRLRAVLAHLGGGYWEETVKLAEDFQTIYFDTAVALSGAPVRDFARLSDEQAVKMIRKIGVERVMFGSDFPWIDPGLDIARIKGLALTEEEKRLILGENARRLFKL
ncbi:MAG: amidohydrolase family protein [Chloroflexota bacterium]